ncbi:MAG: type III glutamate--ammonia ligase [Proteobacteria bacterium]|nr:type III glutamate--ammonia ligase [Pseudomonadota bacterium]
MDNASTDLRSLETALRDRGVKYLLASYVDMHGVSKGKVVPVAHLPQMVSGSELCTGAALDGVPQDINDEEVAAHPDPASCTVLPWQKDVAWFASDLWCEGAPFEPCSRNILKRMLAKARDMGFKLNCGMEAEFFVLRDAEGGYVPVSNRENLAKPAYDVARLLDNLPWLGELVDAMNDLGWDVYSFDHEDGIGQFEIDFDYTDGLVMADRYVFFRRMAHEIARKHGAFATFMPKPFPDRAGSGAHFNMSLASLKDGRNLFTAEKDARGNRISALGYKFIAGLIKHLPAICAVVAPTVNSYKRLIIRGSASGFTWAPVFVCYGGNNRTNTVRIPLAGGRAELRVADSACNPYLGIAMAMAAGLEGIERDLDPGEPHRDNMYLKSAEELARLGVSLLPRSLGEALEAFAADPLSRQVMGEKMFAAWLEHKREEWRSYTSHVTDWEKARYLKFF